MGRPIQHISDVCHKKPPLSFFLNDGIKDSEKSILLLFLATKMVKTPIYAIQPPFHDITPWSLTKITPNKTKDNLSPEVQRGSSVYINIFCCTTVYYFKFRLHRSNFCPGFGGEFPTNVSR